MLSHHQPCVRTLFSTDWMGNDAESATLWVFRQNGLLMPWIFVVYALCTMLADHPDTQSTTQTTCLFQKCEANVKVATPWQTAYWGILTSLVLVLSSMLSITMISRRVVNAYLMSGWMRPPCRLHRLEHSSSTRWRWHPSRRAAECPASLTSWLWTRTRRQFEPAVEQTRCDQRCHQRCEHNLQ